MGTPKEEPQQQIWVCKQCEKPLGSKGVTSRRYGVHYFCQHCYDSIKNSEAIMESAEVTIV